MDSNVNIKIEALDNSKAAFASVSKNIEEVRGATSKVTSKLEDMAPTFRRVAAAGATAFASISAFAGVSIKGAAEAEVAQKRLAHVIQTSTGASNEQVKALIDQAEALERVGVVSADAINIMQEEAASFDLSAEAIERLTPAAADFAVALYGINPSAEQARQAMTGLGKALQGQLELLTKKGYQLDEDSEAILKNGTEHERVSEMIKILGSNYQDLNISMRDTTEGGLAGMTFATGALSDSIGESLVPIFNKLKETLIPVLATITEWIEQNPELTQTIILTGLAITGLVTAVGLLGLALPPVIAGFALLAGPVGVMIAILGALAFAVMKVVQIFQLLRDDGALVWAGIKVMMKDAADFILKYTIDPLIAGFEKILKYIQKVRDGIKSIGGKVGSFTSGIGSSVSSLISRVTPFAEGGIVTGPTLGLVGEAGPEAIIPLSRAASFPGIGGGITVNITGNSFMGERDMAEKVGDQLIRILKQNGRL